jgi:predicted dehydrogenase
MSDRNDSRKVRWGVLGVAGIATKKVIPAMQQGRHSDIVAVASRDLNRAQKAAAQLNIPRAYGSYEGLLADPEIDAIYNPLPNNLHVPWSIRALEAGKHVLCEKPIGLSVQEARQLMAVRDRTGLKVGEAFMVLTHPQWLRARELVQTGQIGELRAVVGVFSYFNRDPANIRNVAALGGGGLMDIGCYPITTSRFLFGGEPKRVAAMFDYDPEMKTDRLTSALLDFEHGQAGFTCSTQLVPHQRIQILGTKGRVEVEVPFNAPPDRPCRIFVDDGSDVAGRTARIEEFPVCNQYTIQGDLFSEAVQGKSEVPVPLENSIGNMAVIDALVRSGKTGKWEQPSSAA